MEWLAECLRSTYYKDGIRNLVGNTVDRKTGIAEPVCMRYERTEEAKRVRKQYEAGEIHHGFRELSELHPRTDGKSNTVSTVLKDNPICEPVGIGYRGRMEDGKWVKRYESNEEQKANALTTCQTDSMCAVPVSSTVLNINPSGKGINGAVGRIDAKSRCLTTNKGEGPKIAVPVDAEYAERCLATPCEWDENGKPLKAVSAADGKIYTVYEVKNGQITIKGKQYPIKLVDGYYIIRKLTVRECMRLQTVPEWYEFPVSDSQAYKMLGNGWTVQVIVHILSFMDF